MPVQILVVDDDEVSREVLALLLHGAGYAVETADSGDAALLHLQETELLAAGGLDRPADAGNNRERIGAPAPQSLRSSDDSTGHECNRTG